MSPFPVTTLEPVAANRPYEPFGAARDLFYCKAGEILIEGPAGTGKSRAVLEKAHICAEKYAGCRILFVRKTRDSLSETVLVTFETEVVPAGHAILAGANRHHRQVYIYPNGSEIVLGGLDKSSRIMSSQYDMICAFEATELTEDDWETLQTRLRNGRIPYQQGIADCNPAAPSHWLNQRADAGRMTRLLSRHRDNPTVSDDYLAKLDALTGVRRARLFEGRWAAAEGLVYESWDAGTHLLDRLPLPPEWRRVRSIDFGYTNPFVCQWWAIDGDGRAYLYRELYRTRSLVEDNARLIAELTGQERIEATVADHDAEDRATLERHGIHTIPAVKAITPGLEAVQARLRAAGDGRPRLFVLRDSLVGADPALLEAKRPVCTAQEFDGYCWPKGADGKPLKEEPAKVDDHGLDALRYLVAYLDGVGTQRLDVVVTPRVKVLDAERQWREIA